MLQHAIKKNHYKLAKNGNLHYQKLAKCTKQNLKNGYGAYILHSFMVMHYLVWSYLCAKIS
jgi:hypothetical protein